MNFSNLKIATRMLIGFGVVMFMMAIIIFVGITRLTDVYDDSDATVNSLYPKVADAQNVAYRGMDIARLVRNLILNKDPAAMIANKAAIDKDRSEVKERLDGMDKLITTETGRKLFNDVLSSRETYIRYTDEVIALAQKGNDQDATAVLYGPKYASQATYMGAVEKFVEFQEGSMKAGGQHIQSVYKGALTLLIALGIAAVVLASGIALFISRGLVKQLGGEPNVATDIAARIADGDLTVSVTTKEGDQSSMMYAIKRMRDSLTHIVSDVRSGTEMIATASAQIAAGNLDLSSRTEQQAASLEETASSMEELTSTVKQNADNSRQANQLAVSASDVAVRGGAVVAQVVDTMSAINDSAKKIVDIISVIDGIAFQTNILALNAAVEAARAGEQGRGFAVVAAEVRNLAQRSAGAAKEIKVLIGDSVEKVDAGSKLVNDAGATMEEIVISVKRVSDIISEITAASQEQTAGIEQINQAITQMDEVTQQNAALVEEAAAASGSLQEQAGQLVETVNVFKVDANQSPHAAPSRSLPRPEHASGARVTAISTAKRAKRPFVPSPQVKRVVNSTVDGEWETF